MLLSIEIVVSLGINCWREQDRGRDGTAKKITEEKFEEKGDPILQSSNHCYIQWRTIIITHININISINIHVNVYIRGNAYDHVAVNVRVSWRILNIAQKHCSAVRRPGTYATLFLCPYLCLRLPSYLYSCSFSLFPFGYNQ